MPKSNAPSHQAAKRSELRRTRGHVSTRRHGPDANSRYWPIPGVASDWRMRNRFKSLANRQTFYVVADAVARLQNQRRQSVVRAHAQDQQQNYRCTQTGSGHRRQEQYRPRCITDVLPAASGTPRPLLQRLGRLLFCSITRCDMAWTTEIRARTIMNSNTKGPYGNIRPAEASN